MQDNVFKEFSPPSTTPTARACARLAPTATCRRNGAEDRPQDAGLQGVAGARFSAPSTRRRSSRPSASSSPSTNGRGCKANNSLECRNCHHFEYMDFTEQGRRAAKHAPGGVRRGQDLHRLPQGHRAPAAADRTGDRRAEARLGEERSNRITSGRLPARVHAQRRNGRPRLEIESNFAKACVLNVAHVAEANQFRRLDRKTS